MYKCSVNREFKDKHTGNLIVAGATLELSEERIKEIRDVDKTLITVLGEIVTKTEHSEVIDFTPNGVVEPIKEVSVEEVKAPKKPKAKKTTK